MKHTLFSIAFFSAFLQGLSQNNCETIRRCNQDTTQLQADFTAETYTWQTGSTWSTLTSLGITQNTYTVTPSGEDQYFLVTAGADSTCWLLKTITLNITGENILCENEEITLSANTTNCNSCDINWNVTNEQGTTSGNSFSFDPSSFPIVEPTDYLINATLNFSEGGSSDYECELTSSITVTVNPTPEFTLDNEVCDGQSLAPEGLSNGISFNFAWTVGAVSSDESSIPVDSTTADIVTLTITNGLTGCASTVDQTLTVNPAPVITLLVENACLNDQVEYTLSVFEGNVSYVWNNNPANNMENFVIPNNVAGDNIVSLLVTDANGCQSNVNENYTIFALPTVQIEGPVEACAESEVAFTTQTIATSYNWTVQGDAEIFNTNNLEYTFSTGGEYTIQLEVTDTNNCSAANEVVIAINSLPVATIEGENTICYGASNNYTVIGGIFSSITWNGSEETDTLQYTADATGLETINVVVTDVNGCQDDDDFTIDVTPLPEFGFTGNELICGTTNYQLVADTEGYNYEWLLPETELSVTNDTLIFEGEYGPLQILLIAVNPTTTCTDTLSIEALAITGPVSDLPMQANACEGSNLLLEGASGYNYTWFVIDTESQIDTIYGHPLSAELAVGNYEIIATVVDTNQAGCISIDTIQVSIHSNPMFLLSEPVIACAGQMLEASVYDVMVNDVTVVDYSVQWTTSDGSVSNNNPFLDPNPTIGNYTVYVEVTEELNNCSTADTLETNIEGGPSFIHFVPESGCLGNIVVLSIDSVEASSFDIAWSIGGIIVNDDQANLSLVDSTNVYSVSITNLNTGCISDSSYSVTALALPDAVEISMLTDGLLSVNSTTENEYTWGYTSAATGIEIITHNATNYAYFENFDPANNYYWVEYSNSNGCIRRVYFNVPLTATNNLEDGGHVIAYPVPAMDQLTVSDLGINDRSLVQFTIVNSLGQYVLQGSTRVEDRKITLDVSALGQGQFYLQLTSSNKIQHISFTK